MRNKELTGLEKNKEISPFPSCQVLVPPLSLSKGQRDAKEILPNEFVSLCCSNNTIL